MAKPTKFLPTDRITFTRQIELLRAYGTASSPSGSAVSNKEVGGIVKMADTTVALANPFFTESGFLQKTDGGFVPSQPVLDFARAHQWNPETAPNKLAPIVGSTWFAEALMKRLRFQPMEESAAIAALDEIATAGPDYRGQLKTLIDYLEATGFVQREGNIVRAIPGSGQPTSQPVDRIQPEPKEPPKVTAVSTAFAKPTEGVIQFHVSVKVDMAEFAGWQADRITSFFAGIAQVLAAKGDIEKASAE